MSNRRILYSEILTLELEAKIQFTLNRLLVTERCIRKEKETLLSTVRKVNISEVWVLQCLADVVHHSKTVIF